MKTHKYQINQNHKIENSENSQNSRKSQIFTKLKNS